ncbi:MAG: methyltransferase domain-containing protein [Pirellula sp.]
MKPDERLIAAEFPRSNSYNPGWIVEGASGGANSLWLAEWLASGLDLRPGMNILDLGCGRASSSIFLAREFDVTVWAVDLWCSPTENLLRIRNAEVEHRVHPIHSDARSLPFASDFFDVIVSIDAFPYFGTDDHYLNYLARFVKPGGVIGIAGAGFVHEMESEIPLHLSEWFTAEPSLWCLHSSAWWRRHWERTGIVDILMSDSMQDGWRFWLEWHKTIAPDNRLEIQSVETDGGRFLGYHRVIGRRRPYAILAEPVVSVPSNYVEKPMLRSNG